uniref:Centrosomal protein of 162 kDa n=1 Tax=Sphaeramia orbicularis TaxID=375764 RepID=A0A673BUK4_9TELE
MEHILRNRNPNSLPALIFAAASASAQEGTDAAKAPPPSQVTVLLERRIQRLEAELESHDEESKRSLRAMEQQFQRIKVDLEQQLEQKQQLEAAAVVSATEPQTTSQVQTLKEELQRVKATHQQKETSLQDKIECLQQQLQHKLKNINPIQIPSLLQAQASPGRHQRQAEAAFGVRIDRLNQELSAKTRTIQELNRTVERLQKERRSMLCVPNVRAEGRSTESRRPPAPTRTPANSNTAEAPAGEETFPAAQYEKTYQPTVFTGSHISEVLQENEALKQHLETLQLQTEQEKVTGCNVSIRLKEDCTKQLSSMKAEHLRVENQLRATFALEHSSSKVAELTNKINTQEILVQHLQEQLKELQGTKSALAVSRTREDALEKQLTRLLQELKEAKEAQSPEVKLLSGIERKICNMQLRHEHREKELQQVIGGSWPPPDVDLQSEVERWKRLAKDKSREVEAFRLELDSILDILRHLQRQGVVIPTPLSDENKYF